MLLAASVQHTVIERIAVRTEVVHGVEHQAHAAFDQGIHALGELRLALTGAGEGIDQVGPALLQTLSTTSADLAASAAPRYLHV